MQERKIELEKRALRFREKLKKEEDMLMMMIKDEYDSVSALRMKELDE